MRILFALLMALIGAQAALAQEGAAENPFATAAYPDAARYKACLAMATTDPKVALQAAELWEAHEGGAPAKQCLGAALMGLNRFKAAAAWFDEAAEDLRQGAGPGMGATARGTVGGPALVASLKAQAGNAWMLARAYDKAYEAFTSALAVLSPGAPAATEIRFDRSRAAASLGAYDQAVADLSQVIEREPRRIEAYILRATANRYKGAMDAAELDLVKALGLEPANAEALLERGIVRRLSGDDDGAKADWERVVQLYPGTENAELALDNLEILQSGE